MTKAPQQSERSPADSHVAALYEPLRLSNGRVIPNRLCKAAMEENLSAHGQLPGDQLYKLYSRWAGAGKQSAGLILTGNVMVSPDALTGPGGVVLNQQSDLDKFKRWAEIGKAGGSQFWMQINHPGRQVYAAMGETSYAPSEVSLEMGEFSKLFAKPVALSCSQIEEIIEKFAVTATLAEQAGFDGVQVHAAHGYLISQFLSPLVNRREDKWGGSLENRARILFEVIRAIRSRVSASFCLSVKLNSADFQKGGFNEHDAKWVVQRLEDMGVQLVELSGGSYESPAMQGSAETENNAEFSNNSSLRREAYFVEFARNISQDASLPIMVTGGVLRREIAVEALQKSPQGVGVSMIGIARGLAFEPELVHRWLTENYEVLLPKVEWKNKVLGSLAVMAVTKSQLTRMANGKTINAKLSPFWALVRSQIKTKMLTKRYRRWRELHS